MSAPGVTAMRVLDTAAAAAGPFATEHARAVRELDGPAPLERLAPAALCERYAPEVVAQARATWLGRMVNEHRSSTVFAALLPQLVEASASLDVQTTVLRAATEEIYHATLCGDVVRALGGRPCAQAEPVLPVMPAHAGLAPLERVARNVLFVGCLAETVAVALITEERERCREPFVRGVFDRILPDEVAHARLGWRFAAHALAALDDAARARTSRYLRTAFAYLERRELDLLPPGAWPAGELRAQHEAAGMCSGDESRELFAATLDTVIVPRLEDLGLDARRAWRERGEHPQA